VLAKLSKRPLYVLSIWAGEFGRPVLKEEGFHFQPIATDITIEKAREIFEKERPDLLFSATSWNSNVEQQFRNVAYEWHIASIVVFDYWSNPTLRWKDAIYALGEMPDSVCVMDEAYKQVMIQDGFSPLMLVVTGQPHLERLWENRQPLRSVAKPQKILFLSQPKEILQIKDNQHPLTMIINAMNAYAKDRTCLLTIKFHPKENEEELNQILANAPRNQNLKIRIAGRLATLPKLVKEHDVVLGYRSMGLFEVKAMGCPTLALDGCVIEGSLAKALENFGIPIVSMNDIANLENIWRNVPDAIRHNPYAGATAKILSLMEKKLSSQSMLNGEKIYLKPFSQEDISEEYISWFNDPIVCRDNSHGDPNNPYNEEKAQAYWQSIKNNDTAHVFTIRWKENNKHIGNAALSSIDWVNKTGMCTIIIGDKNSWGRGVGTEVYELLLEFGFNTLDLQRITSAQTTRNTAMNKICEHVGMKSQGLSSKKLDKDGQALDIVGYAITKEEYEAVAKIARLTNV